jgi:hypothetical protein
LLLAASRFLADKAGFGMTRRLLLHKLHHDPRVRSIGATCTSAPR